MSIIQALLLGLVQGLTEFLPVSSSGHLALIENLFQFSSQKGLLFEVLLHIGTLAAVLTAFRQDLKKLFWESCKSVYDLWDNIRTYFHNRNHQDAKRYKKVISNNYRKLTLLLLVTTIPTAVEGFWLKTAAIQAKGNLLAPAVGFFLTGVLLLVVDFFPAGNKIPKDVGYGAALLIGIAQGIAVFPGISRSGITIAVCMLLGFNRKFAVKYSFLAAIPVIVGAGIVELTGTSDTITSPETIGIYIVAAVVAAFVGFFCIKTMLTLVRKKRFCYFAVYCFILGIACVVCSYIL